MRFPWQRLIDALSTVLSRTPDPDEGLPADARRELDRWDAEDIDAYHRDHGGEAPPDAPHIDDGGI